MDQDKELLESLQKAIIKLKTTQLELTNLQKKIDEPIAIIGMSCRFPGGANDPNSFWHLLSQGYDGISEIPQERWDVDFYYDPDPEAPGKMNVRQGGFLNKPVDTFDANFFGISPREAEYMDPQQRLLLEVTWEALENACINPLSLKGSRTGVFMGLCSHDYRDLVDKLGSSEDLNVYMLGGNTGSVLSGRLSYFLGIQGPCITLDTACSSSLVALNFACKSLQSSACQLALAGGVNLIWNPDLTIFFVKSHALAKDGHCKTFDASADGYVRSEGCGVVVLKRYSDAIRDQDPILALIRATEVNQDGASSGLTVPNGEAQATLIRQALEQAKLEPDAIDYIEAHGTGTPLGDPIELGALSNVFSGRKDHPLWIGTVKTNIGHLEAAAGVAGVIKTVLTLNHEAIPQNLHFQHLNPNISLDSIPAKIPLTLTPWQRSSRPRIAGVSSFGFSGTNAHAIIEEPPLVEYKKNAIDRPWHLLTLSAKTQAALDQLINLYTKLPEEDLADIAFTANTGRAHFSHRIAVLSQTRDEFLQHLQKGEYLIGQASTKPPKITFIFTGQTVKNAELMETSPIFKEAMERSKGLYEYALFELWKSWGIVPDYVAGEGIGDIIAAIGAGIITLENGLNLIAFKDTKDISYREPQIGFISSWTGQVIRKEGLTAEYWKSHENIKNIPVGTLVISTQSNWKDLIQTLARLYLNGIQIDWKAFDKPYNRKKVFLPTYPFQRERYWVEALKTHKKRRLPAQAHPLLGELIPSPSEEKLFRNEIDLDFLPYLKDHQVFDSILFPGAGFTELMHAAGAKLYQGQSFTIKNFIIEQPLALDIKKATPIELLVLPKEGGYTASVYSVEEQAWILHAKGELSMIEAIPTLKMEWEHLRTVCQKSIDIDALYNHFDALGLHYGKEFQTLRNLWTGNSEFITELEGNASAALIDGSLQALASLATKEDTQNSVYLPYSIDQISCYSEIGTSIHVHGKLKQVTEDSTTAEIQIFSYDGKLLMEIEGFHARKTTQDHLRRMLTKQAGLEAASWFYQISWLPKPLEETEEPLKSPWLIVSQKEEDIEGLQTKTVKPEQAVTEIVENPPAGVLWFASGEDSLKYALELVQALGKLETKPSLYFITHGIQPVGPITDLENAPFNGFYKTLRMEMPTLDSRHIDLGFNEKLPLRELFAADLEGQVTYAEGIRYVPRLLPARNVKRSGKKLMIPMAQSFRLDTSVGGSFANLYLRSQDEISTIGSHEIAVEVKAAGLNFRDVLVAMGFQLGQPGPLGGECAGIVTSVGKDVTEFKLGDPVVGFGCFASHVVALVEHFTLMPPKLKFSEAASIPIVFSTAYQALINLAKIKAGEKVLIHAAAGGVGLAAIQIAQQAGAEIYATASSQEKHAYLRSLGINHIYNSRTLDYAEEINRDTQGQGVNIVLNSLSGEGFIAKTVSVCHQGARFVEIGKRNIWSKESMHAIRPDIDYFILALDDMIVHQPQDVHKLLQTVTAQFAEGKFNALPSTCFPITDAESAFEYLQRAKNIGKVVLTLPEAKQLKIDPSGSYLITGGLGALGFKVAEWLAKQGAKHLVLSGRRISQKIEIPNATVETVAIDISQRPAVDALMQKFGRDWPELKGIIHAAGVLDDAILASQDWSKFEKVFAPKIQGSRNLHEASLTIPLDFFVLFSSVASSLGSPGQINYSSANAYMEALAYLRQEKGLPALAISWGPWAEVGLAAKLTERHRAAGFIAFKPDEGIKAFELALTETSCPHVSVANVDWKLVHSQQTFLSELIAAKTAETPILLQRLTDALPSERKDILTDYLQQSVGKILGLSSINPEVGFFEAGMDSLMTEELQEKLQADIGNLHRFPSSVAFDYPSVQKLTQYFEEHIFPLIGIKAIIQKAAPAKVTGETDLIAIIGLGCRFPGGANAPQAFWELLKQGFDGITEVPPDRWDIDTVYDPDPEAPGKMYVRRGGFLDVSIDTFDANFFGISPREAEYMDPQQRLLLEVAWEALENACINPLSLKGSKTGVFMGLCSHDYSDLISKAQLTDLINAYLGSGNAGSVLAGRLSYILGLQGPSMVLDTACSSSLVAIHTACKNLQSGECQLALAGGVNVILSPDVTINFCKGHMLAKDGYCKTFDAEADGYVRGEGCGVVVLKRLDDAIRDQDSILGVIRGTDVNQDGATSGLTVPNGEAQTALICCTLEQAKLEPNNIDYIEAHGTGTSLGDPIEVGALSNVFNGRKDLPLWLGTVKTNIGHLEAAAGVAGIIKTVLALNHEAIPPHLHFKQLNPRISLDSIPAKIPLTLTPWQRSSRPRIAGVSSFGFSGTNAHVIIEEPPLIELKKKLVDRPWHLLTLSAKNQSALDQLVILYTKQLPEEDLADITFTANTGRAHFLHRVTVLAQKKDELLQHLHTGDYLICQASANPPKVAFIFTGQAVENAELMETSPAFKDALNLSKGLYEYALFELWKSWGVVPDYVAGEGIGEPIAAIAAGIITVEEGLKLIDSKENPVEQTKIANEIQYREPSIGFISSWTGQVIRKEGLTADYWKPHENIKNIPEGTLVISTQGNWKDILQTLSRLYLNGIQIDWKAFDKPYNRKKVSLPTYPFQKEHYWIEAIQPNNFLSPRGPETTKLHPFLIHQMDSLAFEGTIFESEINAKWPNFIKDHLIYQIPVVAGATYLSTILAAAKILFNQETYELQNIEFLNPLILPDGQTKLVQTLIHPLENGQRRFEIVSRPKGEKDVWTIHIKGFLKEEQSLLPKEHESLSTIQSRCSLEYSKDEIYHFVQEFELTLGDHFQWIEKIYVGENELLGQLRLPNGKVEEQGYILHPGLIDSCLQTIFSLMINQESKDKVLSIPFGIGKFYYDERLGEPVWIHIFFHPKSDGFDIIDFILLNAQGQPVGQIANFTARPAPKETLLKNRSLKKEINWLYEISWIAKPLDITETHLNKPWLIVSSKEEMLEGLQSNTISPEQAVAGIAENKPAGVVWFATGEDSLKHALTFVQAFGKLENRPQLYFITHGIQPVGPITDLDNATFNGFFRTLKLEIPTPDCRHIDLAPNEKFPVVELLAADQEWQVAYRQGIRYVPRLMHIKQFLLDNRALKIDPDGSYLITGGLGGLGLAVAEWLAKQGAKHLVLAGRKISKNIEIPLATVEKVSLDVSQKSAVDALMLKFGREWPELKGIIHAAGVLDDGVLFSQDWSKFETVFAPKVKGSWNLHEASLGKPLEFFILFSSVSSILGSPGQINYAAANAYLDALATFRHDKGLPALAINWGSWAGVGMAANLTERHKAGGLIAFKLDEGLKVLEIVLNQYYSNLIAANIDWKSFPYRQTFLTELIGIKSKPAETTNLLQLLTDASPSKRKKVLIDYLQGAIGKILGSSSLPPDLGFFEAGMDSLMAVELRNKLQVELGVNYELTSTLAFDYPTVSNLAEYILNVILKNKISCDKIDLIDKSNKTMEEITKEVLNMDFKEINKLFD